MKPYRTLKPLERGGIVIPVGAVITADEIEGQWLVENAVAEPAIGVVTKAQQPAAAAPAPHPARRPSGCSGCGW